VRAETFFRAAEEKRGADGTATGWANTENSSNSSRDLLETPLHVATGTQHVGFRVNEEEFLLAVSCVREIIMVPTITFVPRATDAIEGILALRGEIMPVLNPRRMWGMPRGGVTPQSRVIIMHHELGGFGLVVDEITDFLSLEDDEIEDVPSNFFSQEFSVVDGVAKRGDRVRGVLGFERLVRLLPFTEEVVINDSEEG